MLQFARLLGLSFATTFAIAGLGTLPDVLNPAAEAAEGRSSPAAPPKQALAQASLAPVLQANLSTAEVVSPAAPARPRPLPLSQDQDQLPGPAATEGWSPPEWFPETQRDALWALEGVDGVPIETGRAPRLRAKAVFVYDLDAGKVLMAHNADNRRPVASLTKVVSALALASDAPDLDAELCLDTSQRPSWPGALTRLKTGTCTTGWDLLGAAIVRSDNGAALAFPALAGLPHYPFVDRMNQVAGDLGMELSTFADPSGVADENLSTAREMTRAMVAASLHPTLAPVNGAPYWDLYDRTRKRTRRLFTTNRLHARRDLEFLAAKTGFTDTARSCFGAVVRTRSGRRFGVTVLGAWRSSQRWADVRAILRWAEKQESQG